MPNLFSQFASSLSSLALPKKKPTVATPPVVTPVAPLAPATSTKVSRGASGTWTTPSDPSATTQQPVAKSPVLSSPAAKTYTQSLMQGSNPSPTQNPPQNTGTPTRSNDYVDPKTASSSNNSAQSAYLKYLTGMFDPSKVEAAQKTKDEALKTANEVSLQARKDYEKALESGSTLGFASGEAARVNRNNAFAVEAAKNSYDVAKDVYDSYINAGKTAYEAEQAASKAAKEEERYTSETAYQKEQDKFANDLTIKKFNEDVRQFGITNALAKQKAAQDAAKDAAAAGDPKAASEKKTEALALARELRSDTATGKGSAVGASLAKLVPFGQSLGLQGNRSAFEAKVNTLKSNLTLENLKLLKGSMSDKDLAFLNSIGSSLSLDMTEKEFNNELDKVIGKLETATGTGGVASGGNNPLGI